MADLDAIQETETENNPSPSPDTDTTATTSADSSAVDQIDQALSEWDQATESEKVTAEVLGETEKLTDDALAEILNEANRNDAIASGTLDPRDERLNSLRAAEVQRQEEREFGEFAADLISRMPETLPNAQEYARDKLVSRAMLDGDLRVAWELRKVDPEQAKQERLRCEIAWDAIQRAPHDPRKAQAMAVLQRRYAIATAALQSKSVLAKLQNDIVAEARKHVATMIDPEATADRELVASAVRGAHLSGPPEEPPPDFATMSDAELRAWKKANFR